MDKKVFRRFAKLVYTQCGISLGDNKVALVSARVSKRMRSLKMETYEQYLHFLENDKSGNEVVSFLDAISTNVTHFFRESSHFDILADYISKWEKSGQRRFRFWSAASSSGEEAITMMITFLETAGSPGLDMRILGTDISTEILQKARNGAYEKAKMENIPRAMVNKYFDIDKGQDETYYLLKNQFRKHLLFKRLNLAFPPFPMKGPMDAVFCRNVMIYFDHPTRERLLNEIFNLLKPKGLLFVGHAEGLTGIKTNFKPLKPSVYMKP